VFHSQVMNHTAKSSFVIITNAATVGTTATTARKITDDDDDDDDNATWKIKIALKYKSVHVTLQCYVL
jgi:hypothetical protein